MFRCVALFCLCLSTNISPTEAGGGAGQHMRSAASSTGQVKDIRASDKAGELEEEGELAEEGDEGEDGAELEEDDKDKEGDEGEDQVDEEDQNNDVHFLPKRSLAEMEKLHLHGNATNASLAALISDEDEANLPDDEIMVPVRVEGYTGHFPDALKHMEAAAFLEKVMQGRNATDMPPMTLLQRRQEDEREEQDGAGDEGEDQEDEENQNRDVHFLPKQSLAEMEKLHLHGNATKASLAALISDEHEATLPDDEIMVPVRVEGYTGHFPDALKHMEPAAFLDKVMQGRNATDMLPMTFLQRRQADEQEEQEEQEEQQGAGDGGEDQKDDENQDSDVHFLPKQSLAEMEKLHLNGNATNASLAALISDEHEATLSDDEIMVPVRVEGYTGHFPDALKHMDPAAFLEKVMQGRNATDMLPMTVLQLRQEVDQEEPAGAGELDEDGHEDDQAEDGELADEDHAGEELEEAEEDEKHPDDKKHEKHPDDKKHKKHPDDKHPHDKHSDDKKHK